MIVTGDVLGQWLRERISLPISSDTIYIGVQKEDLSIVGAVAYNCWLEDSVFMHVCFDAHSVTREILREAFMYPFVACGKARVYGMTPITSERALRFSKRLGFRPISQTPDFLLQVMTRQECRWINDSASTDRRGSSRNATSAPCSPGAEY